ncbi:MAG: hypothetical protein LAT81_16975 [Oceanicaulis sp.]|nr:hypothetical protein [Oceanicaulis sp.]
MNSEIRSLLIQIAKRKSTIGYQQISDQCQLGYDMGNQDHRTQLGLDLGDVSVFEHENGRPLLSAVVVSKDKNLPGPGFFEEAFDLGIYNGSKKQEDKEKFFIEELNRVYDFHAKK